MKIDTILAEIDLGAIALPEFQRGYVWNREQVRNLMESLYRKHPVGALLTWDTSAATAELRGDNQAPHGSLKLLLDGQQRITSLYGIIKGQPPPFFDGNSQTFTGLYFNLKEEGFEFYAPFKMANDPYWVNVTDLMKQNIGPYVQVLTGIPDAQPGLNTYISRLGNVHNIKEIDLHIEEVAGEDKTVDVVVDIFNKVNSGGTKLSKGDLALAKICADWRDARREMKARLDNWAKHGYFFKLDWLLRCITALTTGEALFSYLKDVSADQFQEGLRKAEKAVNSLLNLFSARLGLDHDRVLGSRYSLPLLARYLANRGGQLPGHPEINKLLYWYIHTVLWGRYAGSTETMLNQDLAALEGDGSGLDRLIEGLGSSRGDLRLRATDFQGWSKNARFYPLLYMLTRVHHARDWDTGIELKMALLGKGNRLEVHHIFPRSLLYQSGYTKSEVNAVANFTFLTKETNLRVSNRDPVEYLEEFAAKHPGAVESHWIPMDRDLWRIDRYRDFLAARRELLAKAANEFLDTLLTDTVAEPYVLTEVMETEVTPPGGVTSEDEESILLETSEWMASQGLPEGELLYELADESTGAVIALIDLAWPNGIQEGLSPPAALLVGEDRETERIVNQAGFRCFTEVEALQEYVMSEILVLALT